MQAERVESEGYYGGVRLLMATCKVFHAYCAAHKIALHHNNFTLSYDTNIPRQVCGLQFFQQELNSEMMVTQHPSVYTFLKE